LKFQEVYVISILEHEIGTNQHEQECGKVLSKKTNNKLVSCSCQSFMLLVLARISLASVITN
jgi:hypothetical protein